MTRAELEKTLQVKFTAMESELDERSRRRWAAIEARAIGHGGISAVSAATGMTHQTIRRGIVELQQTGEQLATTIRRRIRKPGGGRKPLTYKDLTLLRDLDALVEPTARGSPMSPLRWTCKSTRKLGAELRNQGHQIGRQKVDDLLHALGYSLQANRKENEGCKHPDRNAQFKYISSQVAAFQRRGQPAVSIDAKKKELVGDFKNGGREWRPKGDPERVRVYDFEDSELGKGIPYGVYDMTANTGWVSVGTDHNTAEFAGATLLQWWRQMGFKAYPDATELLITADGGGSNASRSRLWKVVLQQLANKTKLRISVCHFPPGTSKWNKIEHRMFAFITQNWRGKPLTSHQVMVNLIGHTTTRTGLRINAALDRNPYPLGKKVSNEEMASVNLRRADFHGEWNYTIAMSKR